MRETPCADDVGKKDWRCREDSETGCHVIEAKEKGQSETERICESGQKGRTVRDSAHMLRMWVWFKVPRGNSESEKADSKQDSWHQSFCQPLSPLSQQSCERTPPPPLMWARVEVQAGK